MEMKHLGSTLRMAARGAGPQAPGLSKAFTCVRIRVSAPAWIRRGGRPGGRRCHVKVTMRGRRGGRGHLLAGGGRTRVTAFHLSESALIKDPICPLPLGCFTAPPQGGGEPLTLAAAPADWASGSYSLQPNKGAAAHLCQGPFWGTGGIRLLFYSTRLILFFC